MTERLPTGRINTVEWRTNALGWSLPEDAFAVVREPSFKLTSECGFCLQFDPRSTEERCVTSA